MVAAALTMTPRGSWTRKFARISCCFNATEEGRWSTLSSDRRRRTGTIDALYDNKIALGQIYRHALRRQVEAMGCETVNTGQRGLWGD